MSTQTKKQHTVVVKVIAAMTLFLLGIPFLMFLATTYYTKKGLVMDVYLMGHEYTNKVDQYHKTTNQCPTNQDIESIITELDVAKKITFTTDKKNYYCFIILELKSLNGTFDNNIMVLSKAFNKESANPLWQCYANVPSRYLPENCTNKNRPNIQAN